LGSLEADFPFFIPLDSLSDSEIPRMTH